MVTVTISEDDLLDMLVERVKHWTDDRETINLYEQYYENMVYSGCFEGAELDIMSVVDNDYVNNHTVMTYEEYEEKKNEHLRDNIKMFIEDNKNSYDMDDQEEKQDYIQELKDHIELVKEDITEWDDLNAGDTPPEYIDGSCIEAKTDDCILISW